MVDRRTKTIQELNDRFRKGDGTVPGTVVITHGVQALISESGEGGQSFAQLVQNFDDFTDENDPNGEHDFGKISLHGAELFWKIDQYNTTYDGSVRNSVSFL